VLNQLSFSPKSNQAIQLRQPLVSHTLKMGKLLEGVGQLVIALNYIFTCVLVALKFGLLWGIVSFAAVPVGAIAAPFFVGTGQYFVIGTVLYLIGFGVSNSKKKKQEIAYADFLKFRENRFSALPTTAEIFGNAKAKPMLESTEIRGAGQLFGMHDGSLIWVGFDGVTFEMGKTFQSWGKSPYKIDDDRFHIVSVTWDEFEIDGSDYAKWETWFTKHQR